MLRSLREKISRIFRYSEAEEYPRRYAVMNAFDGVMTVLGIVLGSQLLGGGHAPHIVGAGVGASLAMGVSGASGTYMAEMAEQERKIKEIEEAMLTNLEDSILGRAHRQAALISAMVDSLAALLAGLAVVSPYAAAVAGILTEAAAFYVSLLISFGMLFVLGVFLGRVSGRNLILSGFKALAFGVATLLLLLLLNLLTPSAG